MRGGQQNSELLFRDHADAKFSGLDDLGAGGCDIYQDQILSVCFVLGIFLAYCLLFVVLGLCASLLS